jgi:hypothetical protein
MSINDHVSTLKMDITKYCVVGGSNWVLCGRKGSKNVNYSPPNHILLCTPLFISCLQTICIKWQVDRETPYITDKPLIAHLVSHGLTFEKKSRNTWFHCLSLGMKLHHWNCHWKDEKIVMCLIVNRLREILVAANISLCTIMH